MYVGVKISRIQKGGYCIMGLFSYNYFKSLKRPDVYLSYPDKRIIGAIHAYNLSTDIMANSINKGTFTVYHYEDGEETKFYNDLEIGKYIHFYGIGWFRITELSVVNEGINESKEITVICIECELGQTNLTSFGSMGTDSDEQGGLDRYCLYNPLDATHSILHIVLQKNPGWSIRYVDPKISTEYRSFQEDSVDTYSFLTGKVSETYECVFQFNDYERSISAYKLENLGKDTGIILNYRNVIKNIKMDSSENDVKTVLTVFGGNDERTNTPLGIVDVNISGTNQIYNFSYFLHMMSQELKDGLKHYDNLCRENEAVYQSKISSLLSHYDELNTLKNMVPNEGEDSTDWTKFGLRELQEKEIIYKTNMSLYLGDNESELYQKNATIHATIETEIKVREQQINDKETEIKTLMDQINALVVNLSDVLGEELYQELGPYFREDTLTDDSFVVTNIMTDREILEMQQALLEHGRTELTKVCYPQFTLDIDLVNFTVDYDYKRFTDALEMFNIIHINFEDHDSIISARLLKLHINWDDPSDFKVTFSNHNSLKETWTLIEEVRKQAEGASSKVEFTTGAWKNAAIVSVDVNKYMNNILNASKQQLVTNDNNEVKIDATGILCRKWLSEQQIYDPGQIWITSNQIAISQDRFNSVGIALGYVKMGNDYFFGLAAPSIVGKLLMSEKLMVSNTSGSYTIDKDGFIAKKDSYEVKINPDTPDNIFSISIDNKKLLYVDTVAKALTFEGKLISKSGQIADFTISENTLIAGNIGLCSDKSSGSIAYWAGNADRNNAPFKVTNTGVLTCSNAIITGGSLKIGSNFEVNAQGVLTAKTGNFSGNITGSYIEGGTIRIGPEVDKDFFHVYEDMITLGNFEVSYSDRAIFQSSDIFSGISAETGGGNFCLWTGYNKGDDADPKNYAMCVNTGGQLYCKELIITGNQDYWQTWNLTDTMRNIDTQLKSIHGTLHSLQEQINNIDTGA